MLVVVKDFMVADLKAKSSCNCSFSDHSTVITDIKIKCLGDSYPDF